MHRPDHWLFEGTGLKRGDEFGGKDTIVGYECDGCELRAGRTACRPDAPRRHARELRHPGHVPRPSGIRTTPVGTTSFAKDRVGAAVLGTYTRGGTVVTCGSTDWAHGLRGKDPAVERITKNVLDRLGK